MKQLSIAILLLMSSTLKADIVINLLNKYDINCDNVSHVEINTINNLEVYNITCEQDNNDTIIYNAVIEQIVITHYVIKGS